MMSSRSIRPSLTQRALFNTAVAVGLALAAVGLTTGIEVTSNGPAGSTEPSSATAAE